MLPLSQYREWMDRCTHCGLCQSTCPVYREDFLQTHLARARMQLIRAALVDGSIPVTKRLREIVGRCLLCTNCTQTCAAQIPIDEILIAARHRLQGGRSRNPARRLLLDGLTERRGLGGVLGRVGAMGLRMVWSRPGLPVPAWKSFEERYGGTHAPTGTRRLRVGYFPGCASNTLFQDTGEAVLKVLALNGVEVVVPTGLACCGMPSLAEGDLETAEQKLRCNLTVLCSLDADAIVTDCTSCGMLFRLKAVSVLPEGDPEQERARSLAEKFWEITDYLQHVGLEREPERLAETYAYHVPCHRGWTATLTDAPRILLRSVPQARLEELEDPERCCGAGGMFFAKFRDLSASIRSHKTADVRRTGASTLVTQCPACRAFLGSALVDHRIQHPVSLLARAYGH